MSCPNNPLHLHLLTQALLSSLLLSSSLPCPATSPPSCPPFFSTLAFPFSTYAGCGHPLFHITCSSNRSSISIKNSSYPILSKHPNSITLSHPCRLHLNLSHTPFYIPTPTSPSAYCHNFSRSRRLNTSFSHPLSFRLELRWSERDEYFVRCRQECQGKIRGACGYNYSDPAMPFVCFDARAAEDGEIAMFSVLLAVACFSLLFALAFTAFWCRRTAAKGRSGDDPTAVFLHRHRSAHTLPPVFEYEELEAATNRFDPRRKIGDGGFGAVFLAQLADGEVVAAKRLHRRRAAESKSFCNEVLILSSLSHPNLVRLHGYCSDTRGLVLVYDYVQNGTLADHLHGPRRAVLQWGVRVDVALQTAMAIEYLHFAVAPPIVHRDVTSSNIFVERDMRVKLGDFGLSRLLVFADASATCVWTGPQGTPGYVDPDYHRSFQLTEKSDVYSFGVVLFELISGLRAVDLRRDKREVALADLVVAKIHLGEVRQVFDPALREEDAVGTIEAVAELAFRCVAVEKDDRPDAREVVAELKRIRCRLRGPKNPIPNPSPSRSPNPGDSAHLEGESAKSLDSRSRVSRDHLV